MRQDTRLDDQVRLEIESAASSRQFRPLSAALAERYEQDSGGNRRKRLVRVQVVNATTVMLGVPIEWYDNPHIVSFALPAAMTVCLTFLLSALGLRKSGGGWGETWLFAVPHVLLMALVQGLGQAMSAHLADRYMIVAACCIAATISVATLRRQTALTLAGLAAAVFTLIPWVVPGPVTYPTDIDLPLIAYGGLGIALLVARRNDAERQRDFVLTLGYKSAVADVTTVNRKLLRLSNTDALTGLANRRLLDAEMAAIFAARPSRSIGVLLADIDNFKDYNDTVGHAAGDDCLRKVAQAMAGAVRRDDLVARYGGEEFAVVLTDTPWADLLSKAESVRRAVAELELPHPKPGRGFVSISLGAAWVGPGEQPASPEAVLQQADEGLYKAKRAGRNCVGVCGREVCADWMAPAAADANG